MIPPQFKNIRARCGVDSNLICFVKTEVPLSTPAEIFRHPINFNVKAVVSTGTYSDK